MSVKIMIVDDHEVVRIGLKALFATCDDLKVIAESQSAKEAIEKSAQERPDIILMDVRLPDASGIEACREIRAKNPEIKVIMLTSFGDKEAIVQSIVAGASGYLLKKIWSDDLLNSVRAVYRGESLLDSTVTASVMEFIKEVGEEEPKELALLTPQEKKILTLIAEAKTNRKIANELFISEKTVRNYVSSILNKLGLENRSEAVLYGRERKHFISG